MHCQKTLEAQGLLVKVLCSDEKGMESVQTGCIAPAKTSQASTVLATRLRTI
jgi:hypothetical protein